MNEAERRVLTHGVTPGCPLCEAAARRVGITIPAHEWLALKDRVAELEVALRWYAENEEGGGAKAEHALKGKENDG